LFDVWSYYLKTPFSHMLGLPHKSSNDARRYFKTELLKFKGKIEDFSGKNISNEALQNSIKVYNETRNLLKELYKLRAKDSPPISGAEALSVVIAGMISSRDWYNQMLVSLLAELSSREDHPEGEARLLISGSELDNPEFIKIIEDLGGLVVTDDLCTGTRYFWDLVDATADPLEGLANRYLDRVPCARMHSVEKRLEHVVELVKTFNVDGIIYVTLKFCDTYGCDAPLFKEKLQEQDIPVLLLDREYELSGVGQLKTRVQAFLERLVM
jgi:benzoyl-CoA reductase/2-hydroxyglutaryl-CoA dehydratase subunit BcrC/BadD/HgdB